MPDPSNDTIWSRIPRDRPETMEALYDGFHPLAVHWAFELHEGFRDVQRSLDDLIQDAWTGILEAWHGWDERRAKGGAFKTYANYMAKWGVLNGNRHCDRGLYNAYIHDRELYTRVLQMTSLDEIMKYGVPRSGYKEAEPLKHRLPDPAAPRVYDEVVADGEFRRLLSLVASPRTRLVLELYFGEGLNLDEIGLAMPRFGYGPAVTKERVRQIREQGKREIRRKLGRRPLVVRG